MKAPVLVVMAAGMGSRYGGLKQIDPVDEHGNIIIHYSLFDACRAGFRTVVFVIKPELEETFKEVIGPRVPEKMEIKYVHQVITDLPEGYTVPEGRTKPWGTAHAALAARKVVDGPFAIINTMADGTPGVRMYEYERIRGTAYGFDAWLPEDSRLLFIRPRIENTTDHAVWTYWWSNIAVAYTEGMRIIAPADKTFVNYADDNHDYLDFADVPVAKGVDISYPKNVKIAQDFFFYIPDRDPKWIAAVDEEGVGMMQCSTRELLGRKLFVWGDSHGGDNWKNFLSDGSNDGYVEIQAGLARTQLEHIPLEAGSVYTWVEAYGALEEDAGKLHGDWQTARQTVAKAMDEAFHHRMDAVLEGMRELPASPGAMLHTGSGWGGLEQLRRRADGEVSLSAWYDFPEHTLTDCQKPWLKLLREGKLERLERAMERPENRSWFGWMHLGIMRYARKDLDGAEQSLALARSGGAVHQGRSMPVLGRSLSIHTGAHPL